MGTDPVGGLVGYNFNADIFASLWDKQTTGQDYGVGENFGTVTVETYGKTTAQMKTRTTFTDSPSNWDFVAERINGQEDMDDDL